MKIKNKVSKIKPNPKLFENQRVGRTSYKPLEHKDGTKFSDVDYFELLGRKCIEMDKANKNPSIPTDYGNYDRDVVAVAKEVVRGLDSGLSKQELTQYLNRCVDLNS